MGINVEKAKKVIEEMGNAFPDHPIAVFQEMLRRTVEALAELDDRHCFICGALEGEPHHHRESKPTPQFGVGDIVKSNNAHYPILEIAEITLQGNWRCITPSGDYTFFHSDQLTLLFPASKLPKELCGYKVEDVVEFACYGGIYGGNAIGKIMAFDKSGEETWFVIAFQNNEKKWIINTVKKNQIIRKLWPAEKV